MKDIFGFGEIVDTYDYKVINEKDARASAGIMFLVGIVSMFAVFLTHSLFLIEWFSITFIVEFIVRVFINPRYAPYMILGRLVVSNQTPDWVEASPKKFAWALGLVLGVIMAYFIVFDIMSPIRLLTCVLCLILLYAESVFGICLGCMVYHKFNKKLQNCPGGVCETDNKLKTPLSIVAVLIGFMILFAIGYKLLDDIKYSDRTTTSMARGNIDDSGCLLSGGNTESKNDSGSVCVGDEKSDKTSKTKTTNNKADKDCKIPQYAIDMGHEQMWLEHNGCDKKENK